MRYVLLVFLVGCGRIDPACDGAHDGSVLEVAPDATVTPETVPPPPPDACVENTRIECRNLGTVVLGGAIQCRDDGFAADPRWGTCGADGKITAGSYAGLVCPFDVAAEYSPAPAATCSDVGCAGSLTTDATWYAWQNTADTIFCCDNGTTVRKIQRCR